MPTSLKGTLRQRWVATAGAATITVLFQVSCMDLNREALERDELANGDGYTWLALVESWERTGEWTPFVPAHNAPIGLETHLTPPFAAVVVGLSRVLAPWRGPEHRRQALRAAGKLAGPLLLVATAAVIAWGAWALTGSVGALLAVCAFLTMLWSPDRFGIHEFDQHSLHLFLAALTLGILIHGACAREGAGPWSFLAGGVAGFGIWSGVEMLVPGVGAGLALGLTWVVWGGRSRLRRLLGYVLGMTLSLAAVLLLEDASSPLAWSRLDRLSGAHVLMGALLTLGTAVLAWIEGRWLGVGVGVRVAAAGAVSGGLALAMWAAVPDFFLGPYGEPDPIVSEILRGLLGDRGAMERLAATPGLLGFHLALLIPVGVRLWTGLREFAHREAWALLVVSLLVGAVAAFHQYRLVQYYELVAAIVLGAAAASVGSVVWTSAWRPLRMAALPVVVLTLMFPYLGLVAGAAGTRYAVDPTYWDMGWRDAGCDWAALGKALADLPRQGGSNLVTYAAPGPELAWFSGRGAVATGCHCNVEGMRDARAVLLSRPEPARRVAERRGVEFVIQCPAVQGWQGHDWHVARSGAEGLYARLARGEPPGWLARVPTTELEAEGFLVWRTIFAGEGVPRGGRSE